jgi:hypothetical protein
LKLKRLPLSKSYGYLKEANLALLDFDSQQLILPIMQHPEVEKSQIVVELALNEGLRE